MISLETYSLLTQLVSIILILFILYYSIKGKVSNYFNACFLLFALSHILFIFSGVEVGTLVWSSAVIARIIGLIILGVGLLIKLKK